MRVPSTTLSDGTVGPDLPSGFRGAVTRQADGTYELHPEPSPADEADPIALPGGGSVSIQFDDGYLSQYQAMTIMHEEFNAHGTLYMTSSRISHASGTGITPAQLVELEEQGHEIGTHSVNHDRLTELTEQQLVDDFKACREAIHAAGVRRVGGHAYPYGASNALVEQIARRFEPYGRRAISYSPRLGRWTTGATREAFEAAGFKGDGVIFDVADRDKFERAAVLAQQYGVHLGLYIHQFEEETQFDALRSMLRTFKRMGLPLVPLWSQHTGWNRANALIDWSCDGPYGDWWEAVAVGAHIADATIETGLWHAGRSDTSLKLTANGTAPSWNYATEVRASGPNASGVPVRPGELLNLAYWVDVPTALTPTNDGNPKGVYLKLLCYPVDSDSANPQPIVVNPSTAATSGFERRQVTWQVPDGIYRIVPVVGMRGVTAGSAHVGMLKVSNAIQDVELS